MAKTLDLQPSKITMTDEDTLSVYNIHAHSGAIDIDTEIRPNIIRGPFGGDLQLMSDPGYRLSLMNDAGNEVLGYDDSDGIISMPLQAGCRVYRASSNQTIASGSVTKVAYDAKTYDVQNEYDASTNYRYTAKQSGYYLAKAQIRWLNFKQYSTSRLELVKNASVVCRGFVVSSETRSFTTTVFDVIYLDANDYLEVWCYQDTGSDRSIAMSAWDTFFVVKKLS